MDGKGPRWVAGTIHRRSRVPRFLLVIAAAILLAPSLALALTFQVDFRSSTYQVQASDTYASLLAQHGSEVLISANSLDALQGISAPVYAGGVNSNYSLLMTTTLQVLVGGTYTFQVGTDWGRGGASVVIDNATSTTIDEYVTTDDLWWANNWNNPDVFTTTVAMAAGSSYTLGWIGFEGCCGGAATIRFSVDGGPYQVFDSGNGDTYFVTVAEPGSLLLVGIGLTALAARRRALVISTTDATPAR